MTQSTSQNQPDVPLDALLDSWVNDGLNNSLTTGDDARIGKLMALPQWHQLQTLNPSERARLALMAAQRLSQVDWQNFLQHREGEFLDVAMGCILDTKPPFTAEEAIELFNGLIACQKPYFFFNTSMLMRAVEPHLSEGKPQGAMRHALVQLAEQHLPWMAWYGTWPDAVDRVRILLDDDRWVVNGQQDQHRCGSSQGMHGRTLPSTTSIASTLRSEPPGSTFWPIAQQPSRQSQANAGRRQPAP
ncbi:MAG: hypothetical protein ACON4T_00445 [Synechococcus sp.]